MIATVSKTKLLSKKTFALLIIFALVFTFSAPSLLTAQNEDTLRGSIEEIEAEVAKKREKLEDLEGEKQTLKNRLEGLSTEIDTATDEIELTSLKIESLKIRLEAAQKELARQERLLGASIVEIYKRGDITTLEMLAGSDSFSDFLSEQEYLEQLEEGIRASVGEVKILQSQIEKEQNEAVRLRDRQVSNRTALSDRKQEQNQLLIDTKGQEAKFQSIVSNLEQQRQEAEQELDAFLAAQSFVSLGRVNTGQTIGAVGSTGYSTGPHLHFEVRDGSEQLNPVAGSGTLSYGLSWMLPSSSWGNLTQSFGCVAPWSWYITKCDGSTSFHSGIDISGWYGDPVVAPADGDIIFRGWLGGYGNMVLIEHDNGIITAYGHLLE